MSVIEGGERVEYNARACALNFTLFGMYKGKLRGLLRTHGFIHLNFFVRTLLSRFSRTQCCSKNSMQVFVHEAPDLSFTQEFRKLNNNNKNNTTE